MKPTLHQEITEELQYQISLLERSIEFDKARLQDLQDQVNERNSQLARQVAAKVRAEVVESVIRAELEIVNELNAFDAWHAANDKGGR